MTRIGCGSHGSTPAAARIVGRQHAGPEIGSHSVTGAGPSPVRKYPPLCADDGWILVKVLAIHIWVFCACRKDTGSLAYYPQAPRDGRQDVAVAGV